MGQLDPLFEALGPHLKEGVLSGWVDEERSRGGVGGEEQVKVGCYVRFLLTDLRHSVRPDVAGRQSVRTLKRGVLSGTRIIQVDEAFNCAAPAKHRFDPISNADSTRCLKMKCTDGQEDFVALEYRHIPSLRTDLPAGTKLLVKDAPVRGGALLLSPGCVHVMGGEVRPLEEANQRKVQEWNEVTSGQLGIKSEQGVDTIEKLLDRATRAALGIQPGSSGPTPASCPPSDAQAASPAARDGIPVVVVGEAAQETGGSGGLPRAGFGGATQSPLSDRRLSSTCPETVQAVPTGSPLTSSRNTPSFTPQERVSGVPSEAAQHMESLSDPRGVSPLASWRSQGLSASIRTPGLESSPEASFRLPAYAQEAADEMAERCTDDVEIRESADVSPRNRSRFIASQAEADSSDAKDFDVDLVSDTEVSLLADHGEEEASPTAGSNRRGDAHEFSCLADLRENLRTGGGPVSVLATISSLVSFSPSGGLRVSVEDGSDVREVVISDGVFQELFKVRPRELSRLSGREKQDLQKELDKHMRSWEGLIRVEEGMGGALTVVGMESGVTREHMRAVMQQWMMADVV